MPFGTPLRAPSLIARDLPAGPRLEDGSRVGIVGSGPAGSFFAYFLLDMAETMGRTHEVEILEYRDFSSPAPAGCNKCGGIVSESLVQMLAAEGIVLPPSVIQRGIDSYVLHMDVGTVRIDTPLHEMRIGAVHRGLAPGEVKEAKWGSFDAFLQSMAVQKGARLVCDRAQALALVDGRPRVTTREGRTADYDLLVVAGGVNSDVPKMLEAMGIGYEGPETTKTFIREYYLGEEQLDRTLGNSMHVFLLNIPRLEFAAIIPKGAYATVCLLGKDVDNQLVEAFMGSPEVRACFPAEMQLPKRSCQCAPRINVRAVRRAFADRLLVLGDCGVTRLYKDGIGAAYRTAKVAAAAAALHGVSEASFRRYLGPALRAIEADNDIGRFAFSATRLVQKMPFARRGMLHMTAAEQRREGRRRHMSQMLWDMFTGSAPYRRVLVRSLHPAFIGGMLWSLVAANLAPRASKS
jgi:flavin-dependent dehydrogenase